VRRGEGVHALEQCPAVGQAELAPGLLACGEVGESGIDGLGGVRSVRRYRLQMWGDFAGQLFVSTRRSVTRLRL
jgi:hypothetical protein